MKALVLDGSGSDDIAGAIGEASRKAGFETDAVRLAGSNVFGCAACFACWVKTPGECAFDDGGRDIARKWVGSDLVVLATRADMGTYSPPVKRALERMLQLALPYFRKEKGAVRHPLRYDRRAGMLVLCLSGTDSENACLKDVVDRNSRTLQPMFHDVVVLDGKDDAAKIAAALGRARGLLA